MTTMTDQGELGLGARLRDEGIARVLEHLTPTESRTIAREILLQPQPFTASVVRADLPAATVAKLEAHPNAIGGIFQRLAYRGYIVKTGRHLHSPRSDRRNGEEAEWEVTMAGRVALDGYTP